MKIINAMPGIGAMTKDEVDRFLESKLNIQLATIDEMGDPNIQPLWFYYDKGDNKLYVMTRKTTKKVQNVRNNPNVYFSIDDENFPYKGVKGKGTATISGDTSKVMPIVEKIHLKYLGTLDHPIAKGNIEAARSRHEVLIEIDPRFFSTWDFGKM
ncbi:putative pyridoxamine 5'-phosphate oxidase [Candidatus Nitrososphaera gargensis Ga9.2]|uniref:Putative pyridoxamine 5'-phosphate oxidase n=1 Tax=Nitrososphaera gargensis (strain Ga9.2) TaxID=1237085 RepID=K0IDF1_NITGG|nr:pyridoxamine 5'-phosphate oxidase family protein [Candidatus Nitrososphaera gargensis]AFU59421.1 putative pyridoxamine 5'-phosphate oxidase [Candidatus Nitrososphaera gargensis Ga9.2]